MKWTTWVGEPMGGGQFCFCPVEAADDGGIIVISGMNLITTIDGLSERPEVQRIYTASSINDLSDAELVFDRAAIAARRAAETQA